MKIEVYFGDENTIYYLVEDTLYKLTSSNFDKINTYLDFSILKTGGTLTIDNYNLIINEKIYPMFNFRGDNYFTKQSSHNNTIDKILKLYNINNIINKL